MGRKELSKGRSLKTFENKRRRLEKLYNRCPKIRAKYKLEDLLSKIKKPNIQAKTSSSILGKV